MFDNLSEKLQRVFKNLRGEGKLSAENMESALREIRLALLEADVNFRVVKQLIENIKIKAMGEEVLTALSPSQQVIKIVHEELIKILGSHEARLRFANEPPKAPERPRPPGNWRAGFRATDTAPWWSPWTSTAPPPANNSKS
jgi:signal recognition particle subunit SRP54